MHQRRGVEYNKADEGEHPRAIDSLRQPVRLAGSGAGRAGANDPALTVGLRGGRRVQPDLLHCRLDQRIEAVQPGSPGDLLCA
jgi:hypothetical protein